MFAKAGVISFTLEKCSAFVRAIEASREAGGVIMSQEMYALAAGRLMLVVLLRHDDDDERRDATRRDAQPRGRGQKAWSSLVRRQLCLVSVPFFIVFLHTMGYLYDRCATIWIH